MGTALVRSYPSPRGSGSRAEYRPRREEKRQTDRVAEIDKVPARDRSRERERREKERRERKRERREKGKRGSAPLHCICTRIQSVPKVTSATITSIDC